MSDKKVTSAWDGEPIDYNCEDPDARDPDMLYEEVIEKLPLEETLFHIGQGYEHLEARTIKCKRCGGIEFNVGKGDYFTGIKCIKCKWELCIHEG